METKKMIYVIKPVFVDIDPNTLNLDLDKMIETGIIADPQIEGLYKMGLEYPDFASSLFSVCKAE